MSTEFDLNAFLPYRLSVLARRVSDDFAAVYGAKFGLSIPEWRVLAHLSQFSEVSVREIHSRVDMDKSKVSRAAQRLESAGLIAKRAGAQDRRLVSMALTDKGRQMFADLAPLALAFEAEVKSALGAEAARFCDAVDTLIESRKS